MSNFSDLLLVEMIARDPILRLDFVISKYVLTIYIGPPLSRSILLTQWITVPRTLPLFVDLVLAVCTVCPMTSLQKHK